ncbi:unnamed protein product [Linum tenue]|uniref:Uncharacterized protein n=1 Tax=Linum tenue TaxID=586396 RepID=A0AAV0S471_9ROSI|nr:unnamed protein product [Linum tenue]
MFKALILDSSNLIPKLLPDFIASIDVIRDHDEDPPRTIEQVNFTLGMYSCESLSDILMYPCVG